MALFIEVTNSSDGIRGRAGYRFDPGQTKTVKVAASRANELLDAKDLDTTIVGADSFAEIPKGHSVQANATQAAQRFAEEKGVDLFSVQGTGKGGQVTKDDVENFASRAGSAAKTDRDHYLDLHKAGGGSAHVTTLDPLDAQLAAQHEALEELLRREAELRTQPGSVDEPGAPSQQGDEAETPTPPADVERNEEVQGGVNPGSQEPKEN